MATQPETHDYEVVIVGAGPAGMTAAMYAGRSMLKSVIIESGEPGGELLKTEVIEDYPGFEHVLGRDLAEKFASHAKKFGCEFHEFRDVLHVRRLADGSFETTATDKITEATHVYRSPTVIVTAGGTPVYLNVPGESEFSGKGVSYCAICDGAFFRGQTIAVIGGGDAAVEEADFLTRYAEKVYLVHRRGELRASKILQQRLFENPKVEVVWHKAVDEIAGELPEGVKALRLRDTQTGAQSTLDVTGVFIFIGFKPNTGVIDVGHYEHDDMGYVHTDTNMMTTVPGLFAAGDLRSQLVRQVTTAVGDATTAAIAAEKYLKALEDTHGDTEAAAHEPQVVVGTGGYAV